MPLSQGDIERFSQRIMDVLYNDESLPDLSTSDVAVVFGHVIHKIGWRQAFAEIGVQLAKQGISIEVIDSDQMKN